MQTQDIVSLPYQECIQVRHPQLACRVYFSAVPHHLLPLIRCIYCLWDHYRYFWG